MKFRYEFLKYIKNKLIYINWLYNNIFIEFLLKIIITLNIIKNNGNSKFYYYIIKLNTK